MSFTKQQCHLFEAPICSATLFQALEEAYPNITQRILNSSAITVNLDYMEFEQGSGKDFNCFEIQAGDEVAVIPPVSSG